MFFSGKRDSRRWTEFVIGQERCAFVVEAPAIGIHIVKPHVIGAAGVGFGKD